MKSNSKPVSSPARRRADQSTGVEGGCACGHVRYQLLREPLFVHCCHCTRCQRETGGPFAHHAMLEWGAMELLQGSTEAHTVPTDSGNTHWVMRCPQCRTVLWNEHGALPAVTRYLRVGTLDQPALFPPLAHIYVRSRQPWLVLGDAVPQFSAYYNTAKTWPEASLQRWAAGKQLRDEAQAPVKARAGSGSDAVPSAVRSQG